MNYKQTQADDKTIRKTMHEQNKKFDKEIANIKQINRNPRVGKYNN